VAQAISLSALDVIRLAGAVLAGTLALVTYRNRSRSGAWPVIGVLLAITVWQGSGFMAGNTGVQASLFWAKLVYTSVPALVTCTFLFTLLYTGFERYVTPRTVGLLAVEPLAVAGLVWTSDAHDLTFEAVRPASTGYWTVDLTLGPALTAHLVYAYALLLASLALLVRLLLDRQALYPRQVYAVIAAILAPSVADLFYQVGVTSIDLAPVALTITAVFLTAAVFQFRLLDVSPVTQESIVENISDGLFVLDRDGRFVEMNAVANSLLDLEDEQVDGRQLSTVLSHVPAVHEAVTDTEDGDCEVEIDTDDPKFLRVKVTTLRDHHGASIGTQVLLDDVTERRRRERQLERQNKQLDRFADVVSHDLRNPLNVATGHLEIARETGDQESFDAVERAHDRMRTLIDDVLTLARDGRTIAETDAVSLSAVADKAWSSVRAPEASLTVETDLELDADPERLQRLLENLFRNSVEHSPGAVSITVGRLDDTAGYYVADDGPGVPPEERDRILDHGYTTTADGTGLGLSIVQSIADAHGWQVTLTESESGGARLEFTGVTLVPDAAASEATD